MADEKDAVQAKYAHTAPRVGERYRHFKGGEYEVIARPIHEATLEPLVVYRSLVKGSTWARTLKNWNEVVERDGQRHQRFTKIE